MVYKYMFLPLPVAVLGAVSTGLAFALIDIGGTVVQMIVTFFSACGGPTTAMFLLGIFFSFTNAIVSMYALKNKSANHSNNNC